MTKEQSIRNLISHSVGSIESGTKAIKNKQTALAKVNIASAIASLEVVLRELNEEQPKG